MTRMTIFRSNGLGIAMVGAVMAPIFTTAVAQRARMAVAAQTTEASQAQTRATPPTIRPGEFYAAPWVDRAGGPPNAGAVVGTGEVPGIPLTESERPLQSHERVFVTVPPGMSAAAGARYISVRRGPMLEGTGQVMVPTGIIVIERAQPGQAAEARVVARFEPVQIGDQLVSMENPPAGMTRPSPVTGGAQTRVLWVKNDPVLPSLQQYFVVAGASGMRVGDQITLYREHRTTPSGVVLPESEIAVAQLVRVTPQGATAMIVDQSYGAIEEGTAGRVSAKMP